jgi:hypothetical protein
MPTSFAIKMWNWTRMGARVIVTPGEAAPVPISHFLLPTFKVAPPAVAEQPADAPADAKADKGAQSKPSEATAALELGSTVGQSAATPVVDVAQTTLRDQTHTADAAGPKGMVTMSDAASRNNAADSGKTGAASAADVAKTDAAENAKPDATTAVKADQPAATGPAANAKADTTKPNDKPAEAVKTTSDAQGAADGKKDQSRLIKPEAPKRTGQIAVFISRKDSKIYVRQNFAPLFQAPVTIAASDRSLGTHVFTAEVDRTNPNALQWSVISLPVSVRSAIRHDNSEYGARRRKNAGALDEAKPLPTTDSATEALDRISVPGDVMARIAEALTTGGSIIVSDQGINQGETGEGTDFIVSLR